MSEYLVSHIHSGKCKKEAKLDAKMSKELQKAAKAKEEGIRCKITKEKILFKGKKEVIIRKDIEKTKKIKEKKVIALAVKTEKKNVTHIYALKFPNEDNFKNFFEAISPDSNDSVVEKQPPTAPAEQRKATPTKSDSSVSKEVESHVYNNTGFSRKPLTESPYSNSRESTPVAHESTVRTFQSSRRSPTRTPSPPKKVYAKRSPTPTSSSSSSLKTLPSPPPQKQKPHRPPARSESPTTSTSTYITTDILSPPRRSDNPRREPRKMSPSDVYPMRNELKKHKSRTEVNYLNYVPGKGLVKSSEGNIYLYSSRIRNASESLSSSSLTSSSSSSSSLSSSTSTTDIFNETLVYRLVPVNDSNASGANKGGNSRIRRGRRETSSSSSSSSSAMRDRPRPKINVWEYRDLSADSTSSTTTNMSEDALQKRKNGSRRLKSQGGLEYKEYPNRHHRSVSRTRAN